MAEAMASTGTAEDFSIAEMADRVGKSYNTIAKWIRIGARMPDRSYVRLPARRIGSQYRLTDADVAAFIERSTEAAAAA